MSDHIQTATEVAYAGLREIGRDDLAQSILGFDAGDGFGFYLEVDDFILSDADWKLIDKAEALGRQAIGQPPAERAS